MAITAQVSVKSKLLDSPCVALDEEVPRFFAIRKEHPVLCRLIEVDPYGDTELSSERVEAMRLDLLALRKALDTKALQGIPLRANDGQLPFGEQGLRNLIAGLFDVIHQAWAQDGVVILLGD